MKKNNYKIFFITLTIFSIVILLCLFSASIFIKFFLNIPDYKELLNYTPPGITRLYDSKGKILTEYALEKRVYVRYNKIPKIIIHAFVAVEDKNFFEHQGIDWKSIFRASLQNILNIGKNKRLVGGSTITQQIVKDLFLTNERSFVRKLKEAIIAYRINKLFSKEKILELYLNQIYLGQHSYGIYIASYHYFGKQLNEINIEEAALLASLPKAPSTLNPYKNNEKILKRRNWAIQRMEEECFITSKEKLDAITSPIRLQNSKINNDKYDNYYTDAVKSELVNILGSKSIYSEGLIINTNINLELQHAAQNALRNGLKNYDKKRKWRGPLVNISIDNNVVAKLKKISKNYNHDNNIMGAITKINTDSLSVILENKKIIQLFKPSFNWILNSKIALCTELKEKFSIGDVILLNQVSNKQYKLEQIPEINGGIIVIENISGKILALVGGYDYNQSKFNRVTQAWRQPGSAFKTFLYLAAFEQDISPNTLILDEPIEIDLGNGTSTWKPRNYSDKHYGLITIRNAFEQSRNLSTLRLLLGVGIERLSEIAKRYFIYDSDTIVNYSVALGAYETTLLKLTNAYSSIACNGIMKQAKLVDSVYNRDGKLLYSPKDVYQQNPFGSTSVNQVLKEELNPEIGFLGKKMTDDASNYQILSLLEGVVQRGSAQRAKVLKRNIIGKTGTTNNSLDTWFIGMTPDVTVGVFVGYDIPRDMGKYAVGSNIPLPIFIDFFKNAYFIPNRIFKIPDLIHQHPVELKTGNIAEKRYMTKKKEYITENFKINNFKSKNISES